MSAAKPHKYPYADAVSVNQPHAGTWTLPSVSSPSRGHPTHATVVTDRADAPLQGKVAADECEPAERAQSLDKSAH